MPDSAPVQKNVVIIGAGLGGLAAAIRLQAAGAQVDIYESRSQPGGRVSRLESPLGHVFDTGPTLLLMLEPLQELFSAHGRKLEDYLDVRLCEPSYRVHFADGTIFNSSVNLPAMLKEIKEKIGVEEAENYFRFFTYLAGLYRETVPRFVMRNFDSFIDYLGLRNVGILLRYRMLEKLYARVSRHFKDERLRMLFSFQAMYLGISPFDAPSVYSVVTYMESGEGVWFPMGGLHAVPRAMEKLACELGVRIHYDAAVSKILVEDEKAQGIILTNGAVISARALVANADLPFVYRNLIGEDDRPCFQDHKLDALRYSSSTYMLYLGVNKQLAGLLHHNVFFGARYEEALADIFTNGKVPADLASYVAAPNRTDPSLAPEGHDAIYILVPVPHNGSGIDWTQEGPRVRTKVFRRLKEKGFDLAPYIVWEKAFTPDDWASEFHLDKGAAFGLAHNFFQSAFFRPKNKSEHIDRLYFAGASTTPGNGIPMVLISGRLAAERVLQDVPGIISTAAAANHEEEAMAA